MTTERKKEILNTLISDLTDDVKIRENCKNRQGFNKEAIENDIDEGNYLISILQKELDELNSIEKGGCNEGNNKLKTT
jgi:hypothetical protein